MNFSARKLIGEETKFKCIHCGDQTNIVEVMLDPSLLVAGAVRIARAPT